MTTPKIILTITSLMLAAICHGQMLPQQGYERPHERNSIEATNILLAGNIADLEKKLDHYLDLNNTISDGQPGLDSFFDGSASCALKECKYDSENPKWKIARNNIDTWMKQYPESKHAKIADALYYHKLAWSIRGFSYAHDVDEKNWKPFKDNTMIAREKIMGLKSVSAEHPMWYTSAIYILRDTDTERSEIEKTYTEGISKFPSLYNLYFAWGDLNQPKWGGSYKKIQELIESASKSAGGDLGKVIYARTWWAHNHKDMYKSDYFEWKKMKEGFDIIYKKYPDSWNLNNYAKFACMAEDAKTLTNLMQKIDGKPVMLAWNKNPSLYSWCLEFAGKSIPAPGTSH